MADPVVASIGVGAFIVGLVAGYLMTRRGKSLHVDWRLQIHSVEGASPEDPDPPVHDDA